MTPLCYSNGTEQPPGSPFAELHCLSNFSFLRAASHPDELVAQAAALGYSALAITDRHSLAGVVRAHVAAKEHKLKLIVGTEIHPLDGPPLLLWATNRAAYGRLARLLTLGKRRASKGQCELRVADVCEHAEGLLAGVVECGVRSAECEVNSIACSPLTASTPHSALRTPHFSPSLRTAFSSRLYLLAHLHRGPDDRRRLAEQLTLAKQFDLPLVAAGDVRYHQSRRRAMLDLLTAIRLGCTVAECGEQLLVNAERHLRPREELSQHYADAPELLARSVEIADRCTFSLDELRYEYPEELCPADTTPLEHLTRLTWHGARERYPQGVPDKVRRALEYELLLIAELRYEAYFLTVWDLVRFARSRDILCQGRGSAANSSVCFCLGITSVDPDKSDLLFERFISRERNEAPDIDVDFEHERREEVIQYLYEKYGRERAGLTAEVICYRSKAAVREVGKAIGLRPERIEALSKTLRDHHRRVETKWLECCRDGGLDPNSTIGQQFLALVPELIGFPRHLSQHVGGMVITQGPLCELVPIENAAMANRTVIEWNKDDLDALGILKVDCLALGMLTAIRKAFALIEQHYGRTLTLATVPAEDASVYEMVSRADTMGVFQIESRAQMSMLPRLRPKCFYDLVIEVAIVRPGPIQGNMVHPYLRRRDGLEPVDYPNDEVRQVLEKTLGVPIFQEQAMRLAVVAAGFTPGEADQLRRAMGAWRRPGVIDMFQQKLIDGMQARGFSAEYAQRVFQQICGFGEYGFPESHAASFALLVYVSAWIKHYYPDVFCAAVINSQPMGFYAPAQLVRDAHEHGVEVRGIDVNRSEWNVQMEVGDEQECGMRSAERGVNSLVESSVSCLPLATSASHFLRLGFRLASGLPTAVIERLLVARQTGPFRSLADFARRTKVSQSLLVRLARTGAFESLGLNRRAALWQALAHRPDDNRPLFNDLPMTDEPVGAEILPQMSEFENVLADYHTTGLTLRQHPISFFRQRLAQRRVVPNRALSTLTDGRKVRVAGLVLVRQRPGTAKGITFVTLEDETGVANLVIRPDIWQRFREVARGATVWIADGKLERQREVVHVLVTRLAALEELAGPMDSQSRDFH
jgi:error-prone DNA polymerase